MGTNIPEYPGFILLDILLTSREVVSLKVDEILKYSWILCNWETTENKERILELEYVEVTVSLLCTSTNFSPGQ